MDIPVKSIIRNARLAGVALGLPGERKPVRHVPAPAPAARPLFAAPPRSRDYELPNPYAEKHIAITASNLDCAEQRGLYEVNIECALHAFAAYGLDPRDMVSGRTYLFISVEEEEGQPKPVYKCYHDHIGDTQRPSLEYMVSLAAHEGERFQDVHGRNRSITYYQHMIVIPPHDPDTGKIPWFQHESGAGWGFHWFLHNEKTWQRMGSGLAARLLETVEAGSASWQDMPSRPPAPADYMKEVRRSCGDLRERPAFP